MSTYSTRPVQHDDVSSVGAVALAAWKHTYASIYPAAIIETFVARAYSPQSLSDSIARDQQRLYRLFYVAADTNERVVGFAQFIPDADRGHAYELVRIYALPSTHYTGVGAALLSHLFTTVSRVQEVTAWVEKENISGRRFYERHGFSAVAEKHDDLYGHKSQMVQYQLIRAGERDESLL